jgi:hypothetical protein
MAKTVVTVANKARNLNPAVVAAAIPAGYVRLRCGDPAFALLALLGEEAPRLTGGIGGWNIVPRPQAVGMTLWEGVEPYQVSLSLMLDGWRHRQSQDAAIAGLVRVARGDSESPPGVLVVEGIVLPARQWVVESMEFGDPILATGGERVRSSYADPGPRHAASPGARLRQPLALTLREYVPPTFLKRKRSAYGSSTKYVIVRAQHGNTPAKIAKRRRLKSWTVIRDANKGLKLKANTKLKTNQKLRVPVTKPQARHGGKDVKSKGKGGKR